MITVILSERDSGDTVFRLPDLARLPILRVLNHWCESSRHYNGR